MTKMQKPEGFITTSLDRHVKIWSREGELWGDIITFGEDPVLSWNFPYDCSEEQKHDKHQVIDMIQKIESSDKYKNIKIEYKDPKGIKIRLSKNNDWSKIIPKRAYAKEIYNTSILKQQKVQEEKQQKKYKKQIVKFNIRN